MLVMYSKLKCYQCVKLKTLLNNYGIPYKVVDIDANSVAKEFLMSNKHRSVPQLYSDGVLIDNAHVELFKLSKDEVRRLLLKEKE